MNIHAKPAPLGPAQLVEAVAGQAKRRLVLFAGRMKRNP